MGAELEVTQRLQQMMLPRDDGIREIASLDRSLPPRAAAITMT
jgi:hypothetical protein